MFQTNLSWEKNSTLNNFDLFVLINSKKAPLFLGETRRERIFSHLVLLVIRSRALSHRKLGQSSTSAVFTDSFRFFRGAGSSLLVSFQER
jgi:hypothetical protein